MQPKSAPSPGVSTSSHLRGLAHSLKPVVLVGESGPLASSVHASALDAALRDHELVKVRLHQPADKKAAARKLADETQAHLCGVVGHTVILYRRREDDPRVEVPGLD